MRNDINVKDLKISSGKGFSRYIFEIILRIAPIENMTEK
tara:strand:- start:119 stop:235 length:117 start_codon:yes stop_codon:yes gene_type:complete